MVLLCELIIIVYVLRKDNIQNERRTLAPRGSRDRNFSELSYSFCAFGAVRRRP